MVLTASGKSVTAFSSVVGKVLAVSPDGATALVSDTAETPNQVYLFGCSASAASSTSSSTPCSASSSIALNITGATAAAFSPDGLKAYIVARSTLYVYSKLDALKTIPLSAAANDVTFLANGAFAYVAGGDPAGVTVRRTCDDAVAQSPVATPSIPTSLSALPDGTHVLAVDSPGMDILTASNISTDGCLPQISNTSSFVNLGQGNFVVTQLIVSSDGSKAYLLTASSGSVLVFNIQARTTSAITLTGNVLPLQASLTPDGTLLYVGASDGTLHVLDTNGGADLQQIAFPTDVTNLQSGLCGNVSFPTQSVVNITAAAQNGASTTYTYTLTSGPGLQAGRRITISGLTNAGNNGIFTITTANNTAFSVSNAAGVTAGGQSGSGTVAFACNPDLVAVQP
jgi:WD40 repeat protein